MKLLTLQRQAPVLPEATTCRLCDVAITGTVQDHLLTGQPGTTRVEAAVCKRCGEALRRLIEAFGPELTFVIQERSQPVHGLIGGPAERTRIARSQVDRPEVPPQAQLEQTREHLTKEADRLASTERALRAEADTLAGLSVPRQPNSNSPS